MQNKKYKTKFKFFLSFVCALIFFYFAFSIFYLTTNNISAASVANFQIEIFYSKEVHTIDTVQPFSETLINPNASSLNIDMPDYSLSSGEEIELIMYSTPKDSVIIDKPLPTEKLGADIFYKISFKKISNNSVVSYFDKAITLTFDYTDSDVSGIDEDTLSIYHWNSSEWVILSDSAVDTILNKITATTQQFSYFAILGDALHFCGDGIADPEEQCDEVDLKGETCLSLGYDSGVLNCEDNCALDASNCDMDTVVPPNEGGGGSIVVAPVTSVLFSGRAYPKSTVTLLKDAQITATTIAGTDANFRINITGLSGGNYIFSLYSEDSEGIRSSLLTFPVGVTFGATTNISGAFITPTIGVDKSEVKQGENIAIFGQSVPESDIVITVNSDEEHFVKTQADGNGIYLYNFDTSFLEMGDHFTKSKSSVDENISSFSSVVNFIVSSKDTLKEKSKNLKGDLNNDGRVNLIDFSIAAYWYKRQSPPASIDLNDDGKIDLVDFSIMAFYWTG